MVRQLLTLLCTSLLLCSAQAEAHAQYQKKRKPVKHRFNAGCIIGGNLSQVDGDLYTGFDKSGWRGGLKGSMYLNDRLDIVVGLLYNQKGSRFEGPKGYAGERSKSRHLHFDYMEVPFLLSVQLGENKFSEQGYKLEAGFSYARLIDYSIQEIVYDPERHVSYTALADNFNKNEFNFIGGMNYFFNRHIGLGIHYTIQMNKLFKNSLDRDITASGLFRNDPATRVQFLRNYQIGFHIVYNVF